MKKPQAITKEQLKKYKKSVYLSVGELKKFIEEYKIPNDALVLIERVEDTYYLNNNWSVYEKPSEHSSYMKAHNDRVDSGYYEDRNQFPVPNAIHKKKYTQEEMDAANAQYHPAWSPVLYKDDQDDFLFINLHY